MSWKEKLKEFMFMKDQDGMSIVPVEYILGISEIFPNMLPKKVPKDRSSYSYKRWEIWKQIQNTSDNSRKKELFLEFLECIVEQAMNEGSNSFIWPTIIGKDSESNLWMNGEKTPAPENLWETLFYTYSSIRFGKYLINFINVDDNWRKDIWLRLITSKVLVSNSKTCDFSRICKKLKIWKLRDDEPFFNSLALMYYVFTEEFENDGHPAENGWRSFIQQYLKKYKWGEDSGLIILGRETKGSVQIFSRLSSFVTYWLNPERNLVKFLDSLIMIPDIKQSSQNKKRERLGKEREKLVFYLLKYHQINGELLSKLVSIKVCEELNSEEKINGIYGAKGFFSSLTC
jgi:hypothetical protein